MAENCRLLKFNTSCLQKDQEVNANNKINVLITGTAKQFVTHDYGEKMFDGMIATRNLMKISSQYLLMKVSPLIFV